ncbi:MAG: hypothetical protein OHK005_01010 [Candidatus Methylacidiphilales bacterium]
MSDLYVLPALQRLTSIEHVHAAFVFEKRNGRLTAREVPAQYSDHALEQIALRINQIAKPVEEAQFGWKEIRLTYDNFTAWARNLADRYALVIFVSSQIPYTQLRQPINLAVLNVEKGLRAEEEKTLQQGHRSELVDQALQAERDLFLKSGSDTNRFLARMSTLALYAHGPAGPEIVEYACRQLNAPLPVTEPAHMRQVVATVLDFLSNPDKRTFFEQAANRLIQQMEWAEATRK